MVALSWLRSLAGPGARSGFHRRCSSARPSHPDPPTAPATGKYKTIDDLPGPSFATTLHWLLVKGYADKNHALQIEHQRLYGPIWRSRFGPFDLVNVASPELIAQVIRQEGRYPIRIELPHWKEYLDLRGQAYGLHVNTGPEWYRIRSVLNPKMLKVRAASSYAPIIHRVVADLLHRVELLRLRSQDQVTLSDVSAELYKFGFEGISSILFETRLGCLKEEIPKDTLRFISATSEMLMLSDVVILFPRWSRGVLPFWRRFTQAWDNLFDTSNTLSWTLYHLARDRRIQQKLHGEITSVCPDRQRPAVEDLARMPYLKAVIKETLRMYPVVPGNGRYTVENEVVVDNYWFPKKTQFHLCHYASSHSEGEFANAQQFVPERWMRDGPGGYQHHPYSFIPFGVGVRACVGKRVAELEMYFALTRLMQHYEVQPEDGAPVVEPKTRTLLVPAKPINLRFLPRQEHE
ncbi:sterol 26-hydroxylase, mitochondrial isoform X2 [Lampris incognitus]|uniref:sterol 26-hydroxylase, mitochondrial isoform X2 n=1 Tax=Lampris incognitus TaxID=2546036 RepID=UPI0024B4CDC1|nr:sterol 26-hydroxylase, mitochondrial isoform X2 [Lampris incognitus]